MNSKENKVVRKSIKAKDVQTGTLTQWAPEKCISPRNLMLGGEKL